MALTPRLAIIVTARPTALFLETLASALLIDTASSDASARARR